ncbi:S8 family serine peptidase [Streptomyces nigra]|uniref:S8 family serine peptidase n=1 Tax=Streptomyces nigra TaxID=1827580 RepID=UPI003438EB62
MFAHRRSSLLPDANKGEFHGRATGTSDSTAFVSAIAALVRAKYPELSAGQVINRLIKSASFAHHKGLKAPDEEYGYGIVRPYSALTMDIPAGPKANPLGHLTPPAPPSHAPAKDTGLAAQTSSRNVVVIAAGGGVLLITALIAWLITRSRRTPQSGMPPHMTGGPYPPQQPPAGYHPYPNGAPPARLHTAPGPTAAQPLRATAPISGSVAVLPLNASGGPPAEVGPPLTSPVRPTS